MIQTNTENKMLSKSKVTQDHLTIVESRSLLLYYVAWVLKPPHVETVTPQQRRSLMEAWQFLIFCKKDTKALIKMSRAGEWTRLSHTAPLCPPLTSRSGF